MTSRVRQSSNRKSVKELAGFIERMQTRLEHLQDSWTTFDEAGQGCLTNLLACLKEAHRIDSKYAKGWTAKKLWVTPSQIEQKIKNVGDRLLKADCELANYSSQTLHVRLVKDSLGISIESSSSSGHSEEDQREDWMIDTDGIQLAFNDDGSPVALGVGWYGIV
mmetsp:Transcript_27243/g.42585  ORF Transcript_27243/g.42585 Transcript_27243/m.42585 type:complete len:164 (+) Transcript_27243:525-1016(+)